MKITDIKVSVHKYIPPQAVGWPKEAKLGILTIETDEGVTGNNFMFDVLPIGPGVEAMAQQIMRIVKPRLIGRNPLDIGAIWHDMRQLSRALECSIQGYIDVTLWDIAGKVAGQPVDRMLGTCREKVPVYASSWMLTSIEAYPEEALAYKEMGINAYKLHPPTAAGLFIPRGEGISSDTDIFTCEQVRKAVGDDMVLMLDSSRQYNYARALRVGKAIEEMGFYWYEDPLEGDDIYGCMRLKEKLTIPLMATEVTEGGLYIYPSWIMLKATDFLRGDVVIKGGITGMMKIAHLAEAFGLPCELHDAYNPTNGVASLNVAMAINNSEYFEVLVVNEPGEFGFNFLSYGLEERFQVDSEGFVHAPTRPGIGAQIDWDLMKAKKLGEIK